MQNKWTILFLERHANKADFNKPNEVINECLNLAYTDMNDGGKGVGFSTQNYPPTGKYASMKDIFIKLFNSICLGIVTPHCGTPLPFDRKMIDEFVGKLRLSITIPTSSNSDFNIEYKKGKKTTYANLYGLCQKFINMAYKYFYTYKDYIWPSAGKGTKYVGETTNACVASNAPLCQPLKTIFQNCDCPLDSIIIKHLSNTHPDFGLPAPPMCKLKGAKWTQLSKVNYDAIQDLIKKELGRSKYFNAKAILKCGNMVYDFVEF